MTTFKWKDNSRVSVKPEVAWRELERIKADNGGLLSAKEVVRQSKPKGAPLHNEFEWSNVKAAEKYREQQANYIIRSVVKETPSGQSVRVYESVRVEVTQSEDEPPKQAYVFDTVENVLADPVARAEKLSQAIRDALAYRKRYYALSELAQLIDAIDETLMHLKSA